MSIGSDRTTAQVMREYRMYHRRMVIIFEDAENFLNSEPNAENVMMLEAFLEQMNACQSKLESLTSEVLNQSESESEATEASDKTNDTSRKMAQFVGMIRVFKSKTNPGKTYDSKSIFSSTANQPSFGANTSLLQTKMPKLKLPNFDGDERKFLDFKHHFTKMVHQNESLPALDKLYYLKGALTGKAEKLIRDIPISDENFEVAWKTILEHFEDKLSIIKSHFSVLFSIKRINTGKEIPRFN